MPIPSKRKDEDKSNFMSRCMSDPKMTSEYPDNKQRTAICIGKACEGLDYIEAGDFAYSYNKYGYTEEITKDNFYVPECYEYEDWGEETEEWDWASERQDLCDDIPSSNIFDLKKVKGRFKYENPKTGEIYQYERKGIYRKDGVLLRFVGEADMHYTQSAKYNKNKIQLGKPFKTPIGTKTYSVYIRNEENKVVKVNFGNSDPDIKSTASQKKIFQVKHNCNYPGSKSKARYWCCKSFS